MGYEAAQKKARYGDLKGSSGSADYELRNGMATVRNKVRALARNSGTVKRYLQLLKDNVVGENGFMLQNSDRRVKDAWAEWCEAPTVDGEMTMVEFQELMVASWGRDGEFFIEIVESSEYPDRVSLNPLESDLVDETLNHSGKTGNQIKMGVEINKHGRPVAYHLLNEHPGDVSYWMPPMRNRHRRVPADRIIHVFKRIRPGQTRGEAPASSVVNDIKMLDGYRESEVMNRRIAAAMMGFFSRTLPQAQQIDALSDEKMTDENNEEWFTINLEPGTLKQLPDGMQFDKFDPGGSRTDYAQYESQVKKNIAMGLGISTFSLGMETAGVSYSTGRSVIMEDRDFYRGLQKFFIRMAMKKIFRKWVKNHILSDNSSIPPTKQTRVVKETKFRGRGWGWIDPSKDITANALALETYQTSHSRIAADRGMEVTELFEEIAEDRKLMEQFGLTPVETKDSPNNANQENADDDSES